MKRFFKILRNIFLSILAFIILLLALINTPAVQTCVAKKATKILSEKLNTKVTLESVRIQLLNNVVIEQLYLEDQNKDTLAFIGKAQVRITDLLFLGNQTPVLHFIGLNDAYINLHRPKNSTEWNYAFIEKALDNGSKKKKSGGNDFELDLDKVLLDKVRFRMDDEWVGYDYDIDIGSFLLNVDEVDFKKKIINVANMKLVESSIRLRDYDGGRPPKPKKPFVIDTTAFNPEMWSVKAAEISLKDCHFAFVSKPEKPYAQEFDPEHIDIKEINADLKFFRIEGDTIKAHMKHFSAKERSGFVVKELQSEIKLSPIAAICTELFIETNNSKLSNYYAMHYDRFPDFLDFIAKVKMDARLHNSVVDLKDVAYFAPQLRELPVSIVKISGVGVGTVDKLATVNLELSDGFSTIKGDLNIVGLPDIDKTVFDLQNGEIFTTGSSILKYAPQLKDNPDVNLQAIDFAYFEGTFLGTLYDFQTKADIKTNLGNISADMKMKLPSMKDATYSGTLSSQSFNAGLLFNQPSLGTTTFNATLEGASFELEGIHIKANTKIQDITFNGYTYKDIIADGIFDKKKFDGSLLINDSNISMGFYGNIDLSQKEIYINATANLLQSDLQALNFTHIPTTLTADFDLNCSGTNIDDFIGSAKLYNINLKRKSKRLDLDSINIKSYLADGEKQIDIESNLLSAKVNGNFLLSEMPNSTLYYLSKYLPNYIKSSGRVAADQNVNFNIKTRKANDLIMAFSDVLSGFDNSSFEGNLNTQTQKLSLNVTVPYGKIGNVKLYNSSVKGEGNYSSLGINSTIDKLEVGNNILNTSVVLNANVGNDLLSYTIITQSDERFGTAKIKGEAKASNDSLFMRFQQSEFFVNNSKWELPDGNEIVLSKNFLSVKNLNLNSDLQSLNINTDFTKAKLPLVIKSTNIDIAQLASVSPLASYQPEGRVNGTIAIENIMTLPKIIANIEASGVKLGIDTIGAIKIIGDYDSETQLVNLENSSGIFNNKFSLIANGRASFDAKKDEQIRGKVIITNFPNILLEAALKGYASKLGGTTDGEITIGGTFKKPTFDGSLTLINTAAKIDYTGAFYTIPRGTVLLKNQDITLENLELYDVYKNTAIASGKIKFTKLNNPFLNINLKTNEFELVNLKNYENNLFYGHVIGKTNFSIVGNISDMRMNISATPTQKSSLYLPYNDAGDVSKSTYITFKSYENKTEKKATKTKDKLSVKISAVLNDLIDVSLILDPVSGDQITASGNGNLSIDVPANDDYSMFGRYNIDKGFYTFTYRQIISKTFNINAGSSINFGGNISNTRLNVNATYPTRARLYDLLDEYEVKQLDTKELENSKASQIVNIQLQMNGTLASPDLSYQIELPEKRSLGTVAYVKLDRINSSNNITDQVSSLLFLGSFIPSQGITGTLAATGAKNTLGETIASQASPLLTNALNKIFGDPKLQVLVQYKSYGQDGTSTSTSATDSRNEVKFGFKKNYFNDRLSLQVGSAYDWGRPTTTNQSTSNFNLAGDFRAQYLLRPDGGVSVVGFRASNYDLFYGRNIERTGIGLTFQKKFNNLYEFFHSQKRIQRETQEKLKGASQ